MIRVISTLIGTLLLLFFVLFLTRTWGLSQVDAPYEHPFFQNLNSNQPQVYYDYWSSPKVHTFLYLDVHTTEDGQFILIQNSEFSHFIKIKKDEQKSSATQFVFKGNKVNNYSLKELEEKRLKFELLENVIIQQFSNKASRTLINLKDNATNIDLHFVKIIEKFPNYENQFLLSSPVGIVLTSIKNLKPRWALGSSQDDWMRLLTFDSLFILPAAPFKRDALVAPIQYMKRSIINESLVVEMRRRNKKIFIGPLENRIDLERAQSFHPDGLILSKIELD